MNRRQLLGGAATVGGLGAIAYFLPKSCRISESKVVEGDPVADFGDYYDIWRQLRNRLRQSPDHPMGQAEALVHEGDPQAITEFVRDRIALISGEPRRFAMGNMSTFGTRVALRAGAGTAYEKAQILAGLLTQTGRKTEVVSSTKISREDIPKVFFRDFEQKFAPPISDAEGEAWHKALGGTRPESVGLVDSDAEVQSVADKMLSALQEQKMKLAAGRWDNRQVGDTPIVKVTEADGNVFYADPIRPQGGYGNLPEGVMAGKTLERNEKEKQVTVSLEYSRSIAPDEYETLVTSSWGFSELAGRQLRICFTGGSDTKNVLASRFQDLRNFTPSFVLQDLDEGFKETPEKRYTFGSMFNLGGDLISFEKDKIFIGKTPIVADSKASAANAKRVSSITGEINPSCFPELRLSLTPRDAEGKIVEGLGLSNISVTDSGKPACCILHSNQPAPRVLFLADGSMSMPKSFRGGSSEMEALIQSVKDTVTADFPAASIEVQRTNSNLWSHLAKGSQGNYNLIVYATDGHLDGKKPTEEMLTVLGHGPRALVLNVNNNLEKVRAKSTKNIFDEMARATGGEIYDVDPTDVAATEKKLIQILKAEAENHPYLLSYTAPHRESGEHTVEVTIASQKHKIKYIVPEQPALPKQVASLRLRVQVGSFKQICHLAGWNDFGEVTQTHLDEVHGALFGTHMIAFEGPPPPPSVIVEEVLMTKLAVEPLDKMIATQAETDAIIDALDIGVPVLPGKLATLMGRTAPINGKDYASGQQGLRTVLYSSYPILDSNRVIERVDILPFEKAYILAEEQEARLKESLRRSIPLSLAEKSMFSTSALSLMEGKEWIKLHRRSYNDFDLSDEEKKRWYYFLEEQRLRFPHPGAYQVGIKNGEQVVALAIDIATGEFLSFLEDGSGGGREEEAIKAQLRKLDQVVAGLNLLVIAAGAAGLVSPLGAFSLGVVAAYGQQLARLYAAVSMTIILLDPSKLDAAVRKFIAGMACEIVKAIALGGFSNAGKISKVAVSRFGATVETLGKAADDFAKIDNATSLLTKENPFSCPNAF